jgi:hypothetical protein
MATNARSPVCPVTGMKDWDVVVCGTKIIGVVVDGFGSVESTNKVVDDTTDVVETSVVVVEEFSGIVDVDVTVVDVCSGLDVLDGVVEVVVDSHCV